MWSVNNTCYRAPQTCEEILKLLSLCDCCLLSHANIHELDSDVYYCCTWMSWLKLTEPHACSVLFYLWISVLNQTNTFMNAIPLELVINIIKRIKWLNCNGRPCPNSVVIIQLTFPFLFVRMWPCLKCWVMASAPISARLVMNLYSLTQGYSPFLKLWCQPFNPLFQTFHFQTDSSWHSIFPTAIAVEVRNNAVVMSTT